jgi:hypothetical protein
MSRVNRHRMTLTLSLFLTTMNTKTKSAFILIGDKRIRMSLIKEYVVYDDKDVSFPFILSDLYNIIKKNKRAPFPKVLKITTNKGEEYQLKGTEAEIKQTIQKLDDYFLS